MQVTTTAGELAAALKLLRPAIGKSSFVPILTHVLIEGRDGRLTVTTSNLDLTLQTSILAEVKRIGRTTTSAARLAAWSALQAPKAELSLTADEKNLNLTVGRSKARLGVADPDDFPLVSVIEGDAVTVPAAAFARALDLTLICAAKEDSRPELGGLLLQFDGHALTLAGADGHRLGVARLALETPVPEPFSLIIPRANMAALDGLLGAGGDLEIRTNEQRTRAVFTVGTTSLGSSLIGGAFPDFMRILPAEHKATITVPAAELTTQIQAALLAFDGKIMERPVNFEVSDAGLRVWSREADLEHEGFVDGELNGEPLAFALNGSYTLELLRALGSERVVLSASGPASPVLLTTPDGQDAGLEVIMPMHSPNAKAVAA